MRRFQRIAFTCPDLILSIASSRYPIATTATAVWNVAAHECRLYTLKDKFLRINDARVAKLADAPDLGSGGEILRGSSPLPGTMSPNPPAAGQLLQPSYSTRMIITKRRSWATQLIDSND